MKTKLLLPLLAALAVGPASLHAQTTAFTYQGKLVDDCCPATGLYDLRFRLYPAASGGSVVAGTSELSMSAVPVTNGLFTVPLNFGSSAFDGSQRWLEMDVRTNNPAAARVTLAPRTELTPTPYAVYANKAGMVASGSVTTNGLATSTPPTANQILSFNGSSMQWINTPTGTFSLPYSGTVPSPGPLLTLNNSGTGPAAAFLGKVGIGTASPLTPLDIRSPNAEGQGLHISRPTKSTEINLHIADNDYGFFDLGGGTVLRGGIGNGVGSSFGGKVGIGTTSPQAPLEIFSASSVSGSSDFLRFAYGPSDYHAIKAFFNGNPGNSSLSFNVEYASGDIRPIMTLKGDRVGIGTTSPGFALDVVGRSRIRDGSAGLTAGLWLNTAHSFGSDGAADIAFIGAMDSTRIGIYGNDPRGSLGWGMSFDTVTGNVGIGTGLAYPTDKLHVNGSARVASLTITGGADLAEPFQMSEEKIAEGSVVVIDEENPGHLKQATCAYDTRVAGIVSGANGVKAGLSLHQEGVLEGGQNVALTGRVYVKADATFGPIKPGDLLTTSDTPGHAMKVTDPSKSQGAILGKAMTALNEGTGMVLVLVSLQ